MKSILTFRLDEKLIKKAKTHAKKNKSSVSQVIADYLSAIEKPDIEIDQKEINLPPLTAKLAGILKGEKIEEGDYRRHLEERFLQS